MKKCFNHIYGPLFSWRLGVSLGIDPVCHTGKLCTFDCVYCQIGKTKGLSAKRKVFVKTRDIMEELRVLPDMNIDYITFSGSGEPTLARNLGEIIKEIRKIRKEKIAVITNSSLIDRSDVQKDLALADFVLLKLDAYREELFIDVNRPLKGIRFNNIIKGIKRFRAVYKKRLALQIMFTERNKAYVEDIASLAKTLGIKEVQLNTPLRQSMERPLSKYEMDDIRRYFKGMKISYVYETKKRCVEPISNTATQKRHGREFASSCEM